MRNTKNTTNTVNTWYTSNVFQDTSFIPWKFWYF